MTKENIIRAYFKMWLTKDFSKIPTLFAPEIIYTECYGPQYVGITEMLAWIQHKSAEQTVLEWRIGDILSVDNQTVVTWFFKAREATTYSFDGVSIVTFNADNQICQVSEYQSKASHSRPYKEV